MVTWMGPFFKAIYRQLAKGLMKLGVSPNAVTITGTAGVVFGAVFWLPRGGFNLFIGTMVITFFVFLDMVDGMMARMSGKSTRFGADLDSTLDRIADAAIFGSIMWAFLDEHRPTALAAFLCLAFGSVVPYARARAEALGVDAKVGIAARSDRLVIGLVATGIVGVGWVPREVLTYTLAFLAVAAFITVIQRSWAVAKASRIDPSIPA